MTVALLRRDLQAEMAGGLQAFRRSSPTPSSPSSDREQDEARAQWWNNPMQRGCMGDQHSEAFELQLQALREEVASISRRLALDRPPPPPTPFRPHGSACSCSSAVHDGPDTCVMSSQATRRSTPPRQPRKPRDSSVVESTRGVIAATPEGRRVSTTCALRLTDVGQVSEWIIAGGTPSEQLSRAQRTLEDVARERDAAAFRQTEAEKEAAVLREKLEALYELRAQYTSLRLDYEALEVSFQSSERVRVQQKELIEMMRKSNMLEDDDGPTSPPAACEGRCTHSGREVADAEEAEGPLGRDLFFLSYSSRGDVQGAAAGETEGAHAHGAHRRPREARGIVGETGGGEDRLPRRREASGASNRKVSGSVKGGKRRPRPSTAEPTPSRKKGVNTPRRGSVRSTDTATTITRPSTGARVNGTPKRGVAGASSKDPAAPTHTPRRVQTPKSTAPIARVPPTKKTNMVPSSAMSVRGPSAAAGAGHGPDASELLMYSRPWSAAMVSLSGGAAAKRVPALPPSRGVGAPTRSSFGKCGMRM